MAGAKLPLARTAGHRVGILHRDVKPANILPAPGARASRSGEAVGALPDAKRYAVLPTREGLTPADSGTPSPVLGRHAATGVGPMSVGDRWDC
ncbi:hypothetical protein ACIRPX_27265 [Streptomyces sp. NPDC101225]|uniref:hypothetical protein n=1 Tax=Streptomyces sp. NPDC101225 TaxID=3366135 RepID=UPI0037FAF65F